MTNKEKLSDVQEELWKVLQGQNYGWSECAPSGKFKLSRRFQYGGLLAVEFSYKRDFWMHVWACSDAAHEGFSGAENGELEARPKSLKLKWEKSAKETAHNVAAILGMIQYAIERRGAPRAE